ncbi:unnamed protein product [Polarella glacialis]|uniref:Uncharacterized protein n=1 Tax=Polarella glacialis TaxID=89957 RepID=A0A813G629_POLGL|nr:unnamed protein product [Polarella glacialis]
MYSRATLASIATPRNTALADHFASAAGDVALFWISMRGVGGTVLLLVQLIKGVTHIMVDSSPSGPSQWGPLIDKHKVNSFLLFGAAMNQFLQEMPTRCFNSVKQVCYGGSCFAAGLVRCSMKQFPNATFTQIYGLTEVFPISMLGHQHHTPEDKATVADNFRMASAGKPLGQGVFIEDLDLPGSGKPPPPEKDGVGQICAVAETVMMGYYKDPEKTREAMPDNKFVRTGDIGKIDQDGFLHIVGRIKDIIPSYGGFNVAPRDVEEVLYMHPSVGQAAVVGVYHPSGAGEAVVAWTTARAGAELTASALRRHCQEAGLPSWQMPDAIHVSSSPLPTVGSKIARQTLQGAEFRQRALLEDLSRARHRVLAGPEEDVQEQQHHPFNATCPAAAGEVSDEGGEAKVHNLSAFSASDAALFAQLLGGTAPLGDQLVLEARGLQLAGWLRLLEAMPREEHSAFLLQATSLLKQGKSFSCEGAP